MLWLRLCNGLCFSGVRGGIVDAFRGGIVLGAFVVVVLTFSPSYSLHGLLMFVRMFVFSFVSFPLLFFL